ncbi:MAG: dihydroorotate dehydrogenase-like protein [Spirochaetales bacterium]|nr:dihydroorotate dehydrogenase-like protein [Spirochaetales bacterium]
MSDLSVTYLGMKLKNPVIAGASGLTASIDFIKRIEQAGAGAIVCKSLFEEEILLQTLKHNKDIHQYDNWHAEMTSIFPDIEAKALENHLYWVRKAKEEVKIPVIGSLNAVSEEIWLDYSEEMVKTGIDALELNFYSAPGFESEPSEAIEKKQLEILKKIRKAVSIPIVVKLSHFYTNPVHFIRELDNIGINGFVLFNRLFQPNINIDEETNTFPYTFSHKEDNRLALRYSALLYGELKGSVCASTGILDSHDVIRMLLAGADAVQMVSGLYANGVEHIATLINEISQWMEKKDYEKIDDFKGKLSRKNLGQKDAWIYKRTQYVKMLMQTSESLMKQII